MNTTSTHEAENVRDAAVEAMHRFLMHRIEVGDDVKLSICRTTGSRYPLSSLLGECDREGQEKLFKACSFAMSGKDAEAAEALAMFCDYVCRTYAVEYMPEDE